MNFMKPVWFAGVVVVFFLPSVHAQEEADLFSVNEWIEGDGLHGIHGLTFNENDTLFVGSVVGQQIVTVDTTTGDPEQYAGPPKGMADDMEFAPDGRLVWTSIVQGAVRARKGDGPVEDLASGLLGINSIAFNEEGRLFAAKVFLGDALYEIDPEGEEEPRLILSDLGGLNGFDFGPDGYLYGPLWFKGQLVRIDVDSGDLEVVAEGFKVPAAANFDSEGELFVLDSGRGQILRIDHESGEKEIVVRHHTAMDNLAFDSDDRLFFTVMAENAVYEADVETGDVRTVRQNTLGLPADLEFFYEGSTLEYLYVADTFSLREINTSTKEVRDLARFVETDLDYPNGLYVNERFVFSTSWFGGVVQILDRESGQLVRTHHNFQAPFDVIEIGPDALLVAELGKSRLVETPIMGPGPPVRKVIAEDVITPVSFARASESKVLVSLYQPGQVIMVDTKTGEREVILEGLDKPEGIAMSSNGVLLVVETGTGSVIAYDPRTGEKRTVADDLEVGLSVSVGMPPMGVPSGIAASRFGHMFVSSDINDSIYQLEPEGANNPER